MSGEPASTVGFAPSWGRESAVRVFALNLAFLFVACRGERAPLAKRSEANAPLAPTAAPLPANMPAPPSEMPATRPLLRCFPEAAIWADSAVTKLLERAASAHGTGDFPLCLACAEEAARQLPRSTEAHRFRSLALVELARPEEARDAIDLALSFDGRDPALLEISANMLVNHLPPSLDRTSLGLQRARLGRRLVSGAQPQLQARLALLEGQALIDLGRSKEALRPLEAARRFDSNNVAIDYEEAVAFFELCLFPEAQKGFAAVLKRQPNHAHALFHLGLVDERLGLDAEAARLLARAAAEDGKAFPPSLNIDQAEFQRRVLAGVARLPGAVRAGLSSIKIQAADLPAFEDLIAEDPPLSPTILGLFRGPPAGHDLGADPDYGGRTLRGRSARTAVGSVAVVTASESALPPQRVIVLYRRNLLRSVGSQDGLDDAITRTLLHEIGHLRGEDDGSLRDRGLD